MIDFHIHSTISDGSLTPTEIVERAYKKKLTAFALTDHDAIEGLKEAREVAEKLGIKMLNGIELSVYLKKNRLIHVLGIGFDPNNPIFLEKYTSFRKRKEKQIINYVIPQLIHEGYDITKENIRNFCTGPWLDRQSVAKYLVDAGYAPNLTRAWIGILDHVPYAEGELILPEDAFEMVHGGGGLTFMAHYHKPIGLKGFSMEEKRDILQTLKAQGLDGIEGYYPNFDDSNYKEIEDIVHNHGFLVSGGSDFHGENRGHIDIGTGEGDMEIPDDVYYAIVKK